MRWRLLGTLVVLGVLLPSLGQALTLAWDYPPTATGHDGFLVYRKVEGGTYAVIATIANPQALTYTDPLPIPPIRTTYVWQVRAYNADGVSDPSNEVTRQLGLPAAPFNLRFGP